METLLIEEIEKAEKDFDAGVISFSALMEKLRAVAIKATIAGIG
jgi:hypothetical protein